MGSDKQKEKVKDFALELGVDDVGVATATRYESPRSPELRSVFPGVQSLVVMAYKELASCESEHMHIATNGRLDLMEFTRSCNFKLARFLDREFNARAMTVPVSYPLPMDRETQGAVADVSVRHAALAAGLGNFGRNNLVLHPEFGSRVIFSVVLTDLRLDGDTAVADRICSDCDDCVESCPGGALEEEGRTDVMKCLRNSQPYGIAANIRFWMKYAAATPKERQAMLIDQHYWRLYQAASIGFQYFCFNCIKNCPIGQG